jgi:hypothetical protein
MMDYDLFLARKARVVERVGFDKPPIFHTSMFPFQRDIVSWALRLGRAAIFAGTGLGKTAMQLTWAQEVEWETKLPVLILAPLAVADQTVNEGLRIGVSVHHVREAHEVACRGIYITNYDRFERFDPARFGGIVLVESSILKSNDGKTRTALIESWQGTRFRLCCTATPAPNDFMELANHAEFLGALTRSEMLATFFVHDGGETQKWRLKGHAENDFWKWMASWSVMLTSPADLGYDGSAYVLPPLTIKEQVVESAPNDAGLLFAIEAQTLNERRAARRGSLDARVSIAIDLITSSESAGILQAVPSQIGYFVPREAWLIWCDLNSEQEALAEAFGPVAFSVTGSMPTEDKETGIQRWLQGERPIMITKPSIMAFGINAQHCSRMIFCGVSDSFEQFYQAIRRCYRFGQKREVVVHVVTSSAENAVLQNLKRKERDAAKMVAAMVKQIQIHSDVRPGPRQLTHAGERRYVIPEWLVEDDD